MVSCVHATKYTHIYNKTLVFPTVGLQAPDVPFRMRYWVKSRRVQQETLSVKSSDNIQWSQKSNFVLSKSACSAQKAYFKSLLLRPKRNEQKPTRLSWTTVITHCVTSRSALRILYCTVSFTGPDRMCTFCSPCLRQEHNKKSSSEWRHRQVISECPLKVSKH